MHIDCGYSTMHKLHPHTPLSSLLLSSTLGEPSGEGETSSRLVHATLDSTAAMSVTFLSRRGVQFASVAPCTGQRGVAKRAAGSLDGLFSSPAITALLPQSLASSSSYIVHYDRPRSPRDVTRKPRLNLEKRHPCCNRKMFFRAIVQILNYFS